MSASGLSEILLPGVVLLGSAVVAVPLFRRLGLGSVLGYFAGGLLIGPSVLGIFTDPQTILTISELGIVLFLFLIGVEMKPQRLWAMRRLIFGLGVSQVLLCTGLLTLAGVALGLSWPVAFVAGAGFVLSSTAVIMSVLQERGDLTRPEGQQGLSILLVEDLMIVPLLAIVAFLSPAGTGNGPLLPAILTAVAAIAILIGTGRWLLDPFFRLLARARTTEVLTAGALLVVLGAALLLDAAGLSMAMGAFLAGIMLSGSNYRHQIEADVQPFKGLLMGLLFLAVGMSLDLGVVFTELASIAALLAAYMVAKSIGVYALARLFGATNRPALRRVAMFAQGGEFAFVLYTAAAASGVISGSQNAVFSTVIILSMALTPLILLAADHLLKEPDSKADGLSEARDLKGRVLMIGFGRFGQISSQLLLAQGTEVAIIDNDPDRIREAARFGFKVYFGDGRRLDILQQSGAAKAEAILVCINDKEGALRIASLVKTEFPLAKVLVRAIDRGHAIELRKTGVDFEIRETVESAIVFGAASLRTLGLTSLEADEVAEEIRRRDNARLDIQVQEGMGGGREYIHTAPVPEPLIDIKRRPEVS